MKFNELGFEPQLQEGLDMMGFEKPTPIQEKAIPAILANKDLIACAQTGTGKTAAFVLPVLNKLCSNQTKKTNTIIIAPTRELALQIDRQIEGFSYLPTLFFPVYGGGTGDDFEAQKKPSKMGRHLSLHTREIISTHEI